MSEIPVDDGNCFACGPENPIGMHLKFVANETGDGVVCRATLRKDFQGWHGIAHGGIALSLLDEAMAHAAGHAGHRGMTAAITARFRKPVPIDREITIRGRVGELRRNVLFVHGQVLDADGTVLLEGEGKFVSRGAIDAIQDRRNFVRRK